MLRNMTLALLALAVVASTTQAGLVATTEKRVNPGDASAPYNAFNTNAFGAPDAGYNAGGLATTWVSYALGLTPTAGTKISALEITITTPVGPNSGFSQRYNFDADSGVFLPTPSSVTRPTGVNGRIKRYAKHNAKLTHVAMSRDMPADSAWPRVSRNTKTTATTHHIPPRKTSAMSTNREAMDVIIQ